MTDDTMTLYEQILRHFPPEELLAAYEPDYPAAEAYGGCLTCAEGQPCQTRISEDIEEILFTAGLPASARLACLQWLLAKDCSSLTHSMDEMVEGFTAAQSAATEWLSATILVFAANVSDLLTLPLDAARSEAHILAVAQEEAARRQLSIDQVNLRFVSG